MYKSYNYLIITNMIIGNNGCNNTDQQSKIISACAHHILLQPSEILKDPESPQAAQRDRSFLAAPVFLCTRLRHLWVTHPMVTSCWDSQR